MAKNMAPMHRNQMSRHSHDVSQGYTTTLACGQLRPVYFDVLGPGDSVYYKTKAFARLQEVVTAFLGEIDVHLDYFFVPLQMLYTPFGQVFAQTNDVISDNFVGTERFSLDMFPTFSINDFVDSRENRYKGGLWLLECFGMSTARMLDDFDLNSYAVCDAYQQQHASGDMPSEALPYALTHSPNITPWIPCAYQAIFNKYFRNDAVERLDVPSYNFDSAYESGVIPAARNILALRYSQRPSDYFTDVKISPLYSAVNQFAASADGTPEGEGGQKLTNVLQKVNQWLVGSGDYVSGSNIFQVGSNEANLEFGDSYNDVSLVSTARMSNAGSVSDQINSFNNASAIRTLFAVDKFLRVYGRAGKTYDDQILAHFGYEVPHDVKHDITHLGHNRFVVTSEPVYSSSASPDGSLLGQVGGQGSAGIETDGDKFTAPVHGVFMCIVHAVTKPRYQNTFSKLHLLTDRLSFPIPEFDQLGMQPMYGYEAQPIFFFNGQGTETSTRIGWHYRYEQFKRKYNRVSLAYNTALPASLGGDDAQMSMQDVGANAFNPWVLSREAFNYSDSFDGEQPNELNFANYDVLQRSTFYERPDALNNIMVVQYDGNWKNDYFKSPHLMFQQDPLIFDFKCDCKKVSWMSETGEPSL